MLLANYFAVCLLCLFNLRRWATFQCLTSFCFLFIQWTWPDPWTHNLLRIYSNLAIPVFSLLLSLSLFVSYLFRLSLLNHLWFAVFNFFTFATHSHRLVSVPYHIFANAKNSHNRIFSSRLNRLLLHIFVNLPKVFPSLVSFDFSVTTIIFWYHTSMVTKLNRFYSATSTSPTYVC